MTTMPAFSPEASIIRLSPPSRLDDAFSLALQRPFNNRPGRRLGAEATQDRLAELRNAYAVLRRAANPSGKPKKDPIAKKWLTAHPFSLLTEAASG